MCLLAEKFLGDLVSVLHRGYNSCISPTRRNWTALEPTKQKSLGLNYHGLFVAFLHLLVWIITLLPVWVPRYEAFRQHREPNEEYDQGVRGAGDLTR